MMMELVIVMITTVIFKEMELFCLELLQGFLSSLARPGLGVRVRWW